MRIPRGISGRELAKKLEHYGYHISRQTGSHIRLTTEQGGEHHITIPDHKELRVGTLSAILADIADHIETSKEDIIEALWGNK